MHNVSPCAASRSPCVPSYCCRCSRSERSHPRDAAVRPARGELPEAAGQGWSAALGIGVLALYAVALALLVAHIARSSPAPARLWAVGTGAVWASCAAQAAFASLLGAGSALGGGWLGLLALGVLAGAVLALALRVAPAARALVRSLRTAAPRLHSFAAIASRPLQRSPMGASAARLRLMRGRAPPVAA